MTYEEFLTTLPKLRADDKSYESDKAKVYDIIYQYLNIFEHQGAIDFSVFNYWAGTSIKQIAINGKWSRRKAYALIKEMLSETNGNEKYPEIINEVLGEFMTGLIGDCADVAITRLFGDPVHVIKLREYINSGTWFYNDYFKEYGGNE